MIIGAVTLENETVILKCGGESLGVFNDLGRIIFEIIGQGLLKGNSLGSDEFYEWWWS